MTRPRTPRPPFSSTVAHFEIPSTSTAKADENAVEYEEAGGTSPTWPELIDPVPSFMPTRNWWGSIEEFTRATENEGPVDSRGRIPYHNKIPSMSVARSSSARPKPSPYFQLLLAGLQVRLVLDQLYRRFMAA